MSAIRKAIRSETAHLDNRSSYRRREIGIRMDLGASSHDVLSHIMRTALTTVVVGLMLGMLGALALTGVMKSLLFEVSPIDPLALNDFDRPLSQRTGQHEWTLSQRYEPKANRVLDRLVLKEERKF